MVDIETEGSTLIIEGNEVEFERPIAKTVLFDDFVVTRLKLTGEGGRRSYKNVIAVNDDGTIRWEIENVPELGGEYSPYSNIYTEDGSDLWAYNVAGMEYRVDTDDGTLIEGEFVK